MTTVYVTHDQVEAMTMGHRVAVLKDGVLQQVDKPRTLYSHPANLFVAGFIGSPAMNLIEVTRSNGSAPSIGSLAVPVTPAVAEDLQNTTGDVVVGVRPEHLTVASEGLPGKVIVVEELGSESYIHVHVEHQHDMLTLVVRAAGETEIDRGDNVHIAIDGPTHVFTTDGRRLGE